MTIELGLLLLWLVPVAWVRFWVTKTLERGFAIEASSAKTGAEVAAELLKGSDVTSVLILRVVAPPRDWFDARRRELRLSSAVHDGRSLSSVALAAFETSQATRRNRRALAALDLADRRPDRRIGLDRLDFGDLRLVAHARAPRT